MFSKKIYLIVILIKKMFASFVKNVICILVTIFLFLKIGSSCYKLHEIMCTSPDKDRACQEYLVVWFLFPYIYFLQLIQFLFVFCLLFFFCLFLLWVCWLDSLSFMWEIIFPERKQTHFTSSS